MIDGLLFANAASKAHENRLLSSDKIVRLSDCSDIAAAVRILAESGYGQNFVPSEPENYGEMLEREREAATAFIKSVAPDGSGIECFYLIKDYLNLKILFKKELFGAEGNLVSGGVYDVETLKNTVSGANPAGISEEIREAAAYLSETRPTVPSVVDNTLDKAYFKEVVRRAKKSRSKLVKEHFADLIDGKNALTFIRAARAKLTQKKFAELFIEGGTIPVDAYLKVFGDETAVPAVVGNSRIAEVFKDSSGELAAIEKNLDDTLFKRIADARYDMFSVAPLAYFVFGKEIEIKTVGVILSAIKNRLPKEEMKVRLRQIYAR